MKNVCLENYGVSELETHELKEIEGGIPPLVIYGAILAAGIVIGYLTTIK